MKSKFTSLPASEQDKSKSVRFHDDEKNGVTVCSLYDRWNDRVFVAKTRVHDVDQYDKQTGRAIAFNKARHKELLNDLSCIEAERAFITASYEELMNKLDQREGLKHIYLMGVEDELRELMYHESVFDMGAEPMDTDDLADGEPAKALTEEEFVPEEEFIPEEEMPKEIFKPLPKVKLTQFANFTETELY